MTIKFGDLKITPAEIYLEMGYGNNIPDPVTVTITESLLSEAEQIVTPRFYYNIYKGIPHSDFLYIENTSFKTNSTIASLMTGAVEFAVFVATAGISYQKWHDSISAEGDILKLFIADTIGSWIAEAAGNMMEKDIEKYTGKLKHTNRFSPGYCGWHITEQKKIFSLLPQDICGITLNDSCLMHPIKSISGVIGIGETVNTKLYGCAICEMENCYKQKFKKKRHIAG